MQGLRTGILSPNSAYPKSLSGIGWQRSMAGCVTYCGDGVVRGIVFLIGLGAELSPWESELLSYAAFAMHDLDCVPSSDRAEGSASV